MRTGYIFLCALAGLISGLSFNFPQCQWCIWFSLVPFLAVIDRAGKNRLWIYAFSGGAVFFLTALYWIGYVTRLGLAVLVIYLSLYWIVFAYGVRLFRRYPFSFLTIPCLWVILEFIREHIWTGFGWAALGYSQYTCLWLIQPADLAGVKYISWLIVLANVAVFSMGKEKKINTAAVKIFSLLLVLSVAYSLFRTHGLKKERTVPLAIIQTNVPQQFKWEPFCAPLILEKLHRLGNDIPQQRLLIYPEASYPFIVDSQDDEIESFFGVLQREVMAGVLESEKTDFYNQAVYIDRAGNRLRQYRKVKLIPFGEYVPLRNLFSWVTILNVLGDAVPGREKTVFDFAAARFSVLICFEDAFPLQAASYSRQADFLVNITNDAWFYGQPEAFQHLGIMTLRAVENRISIARSANTGLSGWVSFRGEPHLFEKDGRSLFVEGVYEADLEINRQRSFYCRFPESFVILCALFLAIIFMKKAAEKKKKSPDQGPVKEVKDGDKI